MIIYGVYFGEDFEILTNTFKNSIEQNTNHKYIIEKMEYEKATVGKQGHFNNVRKLEKWNDFIQQADEEELVVLMDTDMVILDDLNPTLTHDIAITTRDHPIKYNAGVVFVWPTAYAKDVFNRWYEMSKKILPRPPRELLKKYKGLTQGALALIQAEYELQELPCDIYNLAHTDWPRYSDKTKVIHIKDELRHACLNGIEPTDPVRKKLYHIYKKYEVRN